MGKPLRVLMVEDSEDDVLLTIHALRKGGYEPTCERVEDAQAMRKALREKSWDVVVCDYRMPKFNGPAAIALLKETDIDIPLIIVSGAIGEETAVECMRSGAHDYIMKGNLSRLVPAIERELKEARSRIQRKRAEEALRENEERFRKIFEEAPLVGIVITSPSFAFEKANPSFCSMMGYSEDELRSMTFADITHPDYLARDMENVKKVGRGELTFYQTEKRYINKSGKVLWGNLVVSSIRDQHGTLRYYLSMVNDITERKEAEAELKESKALFESVVENVPLMIFLKEATDLRFVIFNRAGEELLGYDRRDLIGKNDLDLFPPEQAAHFMTKDREVLDGETGMLDIPEEPILTARKGQRLLHTRKVCIRGSDGATKFLLGISEDITERKEAEQKLQDTLDSLRRAVNTTIQVMVSAVEARDPYTAGHQIRSADLARSIATEMGLPHEKIEGIRIAGSIHDIGKLSIPAEILSKPTKLSELEFSLIKEHPRKGYEILKDVESPWPLAEIVYQHHERMDGSGYPGNLKGDDILIEAHIMAVADVVEAMASHRPYRPSLGIDVALEEISKNRGILYDPEAVDACLRLFNDKGYKFE